MQAKSTLAEENALMSEALTATRMGDNAHALAVLEILLRSYPASPLAENAMVERFRVLRRMGNVEGAANAARRYLEDHPHGMANDEARSLAHGDTP